MIFLLSSFVGFSITASAQKAAFSEADIKKAGNNRAAILFRTQPPLSLPITVTKTTWTEKDEEQFGKFVTGMAKAVEAKKCNSVRSCFQNVEANPYAVTDPKTLVLYADCGIFPYVLRAYFAFKNHLPFETVTNSVILNRPYSSEVSEALDEQLKIAEGETAPYGNQIESRDVKSNADRPGEERNFQIYSGQIVDFISTRIYRVGPLTPNHDQTDLYPVSLDRKGIRPGTIMHTTGHVAIVSYVEPTGVIHLVDAHPDGSVSAKKIVDATTFQRSRPDQGLGFYRFRKMTLVGAQMINGSLYGGHIVRSTDEQLFKQGMFSLDQFFGPDSKVKPHSQVDPTLWKKGFKKIDFIAYLEKQMRPLDLETNAIDEVTEALKSFCHIAEQRVEDVAKALSTDNKMNQVAHPDHLPANIFTTPEIAWESYSTPGKDGALRESVQTIVKTAIEKFRQSRERGSKVHFKGSAEEYQQALRARLSQFGKKCLISYKKSDGTSVSLNMLDVISRLTKISADPYHCAERRWGAGGAELLSCSDLDQGGQWYAAEQVVRNTIGKQLPSELLVVRSNRPITLEMLQDPSLSDQPESSDVNLGSKKVPNLNLDGIFASSTFLKALNQN